MSSYIQQLPQLVTMALRENKKSNWGDNQI